MIIGTWGILKSENTSIQLDYYGVKVQANTPEDPESFSVSLISMKGEEIPLEQGSYSVENIFGMITEPSRKFELPPAAGFAEGSTCRWYWIDWRLVYICR